MLPSVSGPEDTAKDSDSSLLYAKAPEEIARVDAGVSVPVAVVHVGDMSPSFGPSSSSVLMDGMRSSTSGDVAFESSMIMI